MMLWWCGGESDDGVAVIWCGEGVVVLARVCCFYELFKDF